RIEGDRHAAETAGAADGIERVPCAVEGRERVPEDRIRRIAVLRGLLADDRARARVTEVDRAGEAAREGEQIRPVLRVADRAEAAHRESGDGAPALGRDRAEVGVDPRDELVDV